MRFQILTFSEESLALSQAELIAFGENSVESSDVDRNWLEPVTSSKPMGVGGVYRWSECLKQEQSGSTNRVKRSSWHRRCEPGGPWQPRRRSEGVSLACSPWCGSGRSLGSLVHASEGVRLSSWAAKSVIQPCSSENDDGCAREGGRCGPLGKKTTAYDCGMGAGRDDREVMVSYEAIRVGKRVVDGGDELLTNADRARKIAYADLSAKGERQRVRRRKQQQQQQQQLANRSAANSKARLFPFSKSETPKLDSSVTDSLNERVRAASVSSRR